MQWVAMVQIYTKGDANKIKIIEYQDLNFF